MMQDRPPSFTYSHYALALLLGANLLNYIDRQVLYAMFPLIKADLQIDDTRLGLLGSAFMLCYMASAPLLGWLGDRKSRTKLASWGIALWSFATAASGNAVGYGTLLASRTAVGVGEASFGTVSPGLISDYFSKERRGSVLALFYLAIPVGSALGYILGGVIGQNFGWHAAFLIVGLPGLFLALLLYFLREPTRGGQQAAGVYTVMEPSLQDYVGLLRNRTYMANTLAMAAMTFALGGLAQWVPTFLYRVHGVDVATANLVFGIVTVASGIAGTLTGGWLGDRLQRRTPKGYSIVSGWGFLLGAPLATYAILAPSLYNCLAAIFASEFLLFLNTGPLNTVIVNTTSPAIRSMAFAVNIFLIHALGDAISPTVLGSLSDLWNLRMALMITPLAIIAAAFFSFLCAANIETDKPCG